MAALRLHLSQGFRQRLTLSDAESAACSAAAEIVFVRATQENEAQYSVTPRCAGWAELTIATADGIALRQSPLLVRVHAPRWACVWSTMGGGRELFGTLTDALPH